MQLIRFFKAAAITWYIAASCYAGANRYENNPTILVDRAAHPEFLPISTLVGNKEAGRATGFNISPCLILTNSHVAFSDEGTYRDLAIYAGVKSGNLFLGKTTKSRVEYVLNKSASIIAISTDDYAIINSPACLGKTFGWLEPAKIGFSDIMSGNFEILVIGYPSDRQFGVVEASFGKIVDYEVLGNIATGLLFHDASTAPGMSGSPIFTIKDGAIRLLAIHAGGIGATTGKHTFTHPRKDNLNAAIPAEMIFGNPRVRALIEADMQFNGALNPAKNLMNQIPSLELSKRTGALVSQAASSPVIVRGAQKAANDGHAILKQFADQGILSYRPSTFYIKMTMSVSKKGEQIDKPEVTFSQIPPIQIKIKSSSGCMTEILPIDVGSEKTDNVPASNEMAPLNSKSSTGSIHRLFQPQVREFNKSGIDWTKVDGIEKSYIEGSVAIFGSSLSNGFIYLHFLTAEDADQAAHAMNDIRAYCRA